MRAGSLTERVILYEPVRNAGDDSPVAAIEWKERGTRFAEYRPGTSYQTVSADENFGAHKAVFIMRNFGMPHTGWRLDHIGGERYKIIAEPVVNRAKGMMTLTCERINE